MAEIEFSWDDLTIEEIEIIEDVVGASFESLQKGDAPTGKTLRAIVYIVKRRTNPDFTLDDAGKVNIKEVDGLFDVTPDRPTDAAA